MQIWELWVDADQSGLWNQLKVLGQKNALQKQLSGTMEDSELNKRVSRLQRIMLQSLNSKKELEKQLAALRNNAT